VLFVDESEDVVLFVDESEDEGSLADGSEDVVLFVDRSEDEVPFAGGHEDEVSDIVLFADWDIHAVLSTVPDVVLSSRRTTDKVLLAIGAADTVWAEKIAARNSAATVVVVSTLRCKKRIVERNLVFVCEAASFN
jgi:hypothetical protein